MVQIDYFSVISEEIYIKPIFFRKSRYFVKAFNGKVMYPCGRKTVQTLGSKFFSPMKLEKFVAI